MDAMASQITSLATAYSTVYSGGDQRKDQSSASLAFWVGNSPMTGEFPAQMASNAQNVSIWWRHHKSWTSHPLRMAITLQIYMITHIVFHPPFANIVSFYVGFWFKKRHFLSGNWLEACPVLFHSKYPCLSTRVTYSLWPLYHKTFTLENVPDASSPKSVWPKCQMESELTITIKGRKLDRLMWFIATLGQFYYCHYRRRSTKSDRDTRQVSHTQQAVVTTAPGILTKCQRPPQFVMDTTVFILYRPCIYISDFSNYSKFSDKYGPAQ